jgi:hypothetical protein
MQHAEEKKDPSAAPHNILLHISASTGSTTTTDLLSSNDVVGRLPPSISSRHLRDDPDLLVATHRVVAVSLPSWERFEWLLRDEIPEVSSIGGNRSRYFSAR